MSAPFVAGHFRYFVSRGCYLSSTFYDKYKHLNSSVGRVLDYHFKGYGFNPQLEWLFSLWQNSVLLENS